MAVRTLNVLLTADSKGMAQGFAASIKSSMGLKAGLAAVVLGAAALGKAIYDVGEEFDDASDTIRVGTGKSGKALKALEKDFKNVVASVPTDFEAAAEAIAELNKRLGITGKPLRERSKQFLELSRITKTDVAENIASVTRAFGDWEVQTGKQGAQLDKFFRASQLSGAAVSELAEEVVKFGAPLRQVGFTLDEATAMFASFEKAGVNTSTMMPGLKQAMKTFYEQDVDPKKGIEKAFKGIEDGSIKASEALKIFGVRAGGDMIEAVEQGRFHLGAFTKTIATGNDTIRKAGVETRDTSENLQLLGNKIKVSVAPAAEWLYRAFGDLSKALATMNFKPLLRSLGLSGTEIKNLGESFRRVMDFIGPIARETFAAIARFLRNFAGVVRGAVKVISSVLSGDFGKAWEGVKDVFVHYIGAIKDLLRLTSAPFRRIAETVGKAIGKGFSVAWKGIESVFTTGANAAIDVLNAMIGVINKIPFVEIGTIGHIGGKTRMTPAESRRGYRRGGPINLGAATGDSVPAMLERGEYVLNRKAVKAVGTSTLDAINYGMAPRFQTGGPVQYLSIGSIVEDVVGYTAPGLIVKGAKAAWEKGFPAVSNAAAGIAGLGGEFPGWIDGSYFVNAAMDWLKGKTQAQAKERTAHSGTASYTGPPASMKQLGDDAWVDSHTMAVSQYLADKFGLSITSEYRSPAHNEAVGGVSNSSHMRGSPSNPGAVDFVPASSAAQAWANAHIAGLSQTLIHDAGSGLHLHVAYFKKGGLVGPAKLKERRHILHELAQASAGRETLQWDAGGLYNWTEVWNDLPAKVRTFNGDATRKWLENKLPPTWSVGRFGSIFPGGKGVDEPVWARADGGIGRLLGAFQKGGKAGFGNIDHTWEPHWAPDFGGPTLPFYMVAALAESVGMPGVTMAQIAKGESGLRPGSAGVDPGGTKGYGLWAITSPFNDALVSKFGGYEQMWNPVKNAEVAASIYRSQGLGAWYGDQYVTDPNAHYEGKFDIGSVTGGGRKGGSSSRGGGGKSFPAGHTGKGGGTYGAPGPAHGKPPKMHPTLPGLKAGAVPKVLAPFSSIANLFKRPGLNAESRFGLSEYALELAGETESTADDRAVYQYQLGASKKRKEQIQSKAKRLVAELRSKGLTRAQRVRKQKELAQAQEELSTVQDRISGAREGIAGLNETVEGEDPLQAAIEANTQAIEQHTQAQAELAKQIKAQVDFAKSATATSGATAWTALADILGNRLGGMAQQQATLAGDGTLGSRRNF